MEHLWFRLLVNTVDSMPTCNAIQEHIARWVICSIGWCIDSNIQQDGGTGALQTSQSSLNMIKLDDYFKAFERRYNHKTTIDTFYSWIHIWFGNTYRGNKFHSGCEWWCTHRHGLRPIGRFIVFVTHNLRSLPMETISSMMDGNLNKNTIGGTSPSSQCCRWCTRPFQLFSIASPSIVCTTPFM